MTCFSSKFRAKNDLKEVLSIQLGLAQTQEAGGDHCGLQRELSEPVQSRSLVKYVWFKPQAVTFQYGFWGGEGSVVTEANVPCVGS